MKCFLIRVSLFIGTIVALPGLASAQTCPSGWACVTLSSVIAHFGTVVGAREAVSLTSHNYTATSSDCGKIKTLPTGTSPTVTLPNLNQECTIVFETTAAISYTFQAASGGSTQNSQNFTHTRGSHAGDTVSVNIVTPSSSAATWNIVGDVTS